MTTYLLAIVLVLASCTTTPKPRAGPVTSAIIFVPGYYGSSLKDATSNARFFITSGRYVFGGDAVSLYTRELETPKAPDLVVDRVMDRVDLLGGLVGVDVYGKFMKRLERIAGEKGAAFVPFAYDWRQDLSETAKLLDDRIKSLRARGVTDIQIVAHSMGCLVTSYYLGYGSQTPEDAKLDWSGAKDVGRVVLMAGPYRGAFALFRNMQTGAKIGSNASYLPAETVASLPASYQLLPMLDFHLYDRDRQRVPFALDDVTEWDRLHLGLLHDQTLRPDIKARRMTFLDRQLKRARTFATRLEFKGDPSPEHLKVLQLVGNGNPVVDSGYHDVAQGSFVFDTQKPAVPGLSIGALFRDGDGSVTVRSAKLPTGLDRGAVVMNTTLPHDKVFEDAAFAEALDHFLKP